MTEAEAIALMETSKTVQEWNKNRAKILEEYTSNEDIPKWFYTKIDHSGLIKVVLKKDKTVTI